MDSKGIRLEGLKLALVQNYKSTSLSSFRDNLWYHYNCRANRWLTQNEAVNVETMYTIGRDRDVYALEETKETDGV